MTMPVLVQVSQVTREARSSRTHAHRRSCRGVPHGQIQKKDGCDKMPASTVWVDFIVLYYSNNCITCFMKHVYETLDIHITLAMGLLDILVRSVEGNDRKVRVVVLGLENSGKTTIIKRLTDEDVEHITPTQGFNIKSLEKGDIEMNIWDVGGNDWSK